MTEFKFSCPACHQKIKVPVEFENRRVDCPACKAAIIIPAAPKEEETVPAATLAQPAAQPAPAAPAPPTPAPVVPKPAPVVPPATKPVAAPAPLASATGPENDHAFKPSDPAPFTSVKPINDIRVTTLTPELKLEIVRAARPHLTDKSRWLPGKKETGQYTYAARREGDNLVRVNPTDVTATHFSLFGAVLLELHRRNVIHTTVGRRQFLDEELVAAIQQVMGRQPGGAVSEAERAALTHEQCLAVLDVLEERYGHKTETSPQKETPRRIEDVRLADLFKKMENNTPVRAEEVICAVSYELDQIKLRLDKLERNTGNK